MKLTKTPYDIFISYRRLGGAQYARILQLMLTQRGFRVFLDYDELKDGTFNDRIREAIEASKIFIVVLSKNSMDRCANQDDWVRKEIEIASSNGKKIIPVNPDNEFDGMHTDLPESVRSIIETQQHSDIYFGKYLGMTVDTMIRERIEPITGERIPQKHTDEDFETAKQTLAKLDAYKRRMKRLFLILAAILVGVVGAGAYLLFKWHQESVEHQQHVEQLASLREDIEKRYDRVHPVIREDLSEEQLQTISNILGSLRSLNEDDGTWISQFEFSAGDWATLMGEECEENERDLPAVDHSFAEIYELLVDSLGSMTGLNFGLPSAEEWVYAAAGGKNKKDFIYAGSDMPEDVAWFRVNSNGKMHNARDTEKLPNHLDMYNMSGNVGELTNSAWDVADGRDGWIVCGGDYSSDENEIRINAKVYLPLEGSSVKVGFRPILMIEK